MTDTYALGDRVRTAARGWWWMLLLRGVFLVLIGVYAMFSPGVTLVAIAQVVGVYALFDGVLALFAGLTRRSDKPVMELLRGLILVIVGLVALARPVAFAALSTTFVVSVLAVGAMWSGLTEIFQAIRHRREIDGEGWMILGGLSSVLLGCVLFAAPLLSGLLLTRIVGTMAAIGGVMLIVLAMRLRRGVKLAARF